MKQVVYTASPESHQIHAWQMNDAGLLTLLQVVDAPGQVQPMVISPDGAWLHVGVRPEFRVVSYAIDPQGRLTYVACAPLPGSPTHLSCDNEGRFLFCASYNDGCVSVSPVSDQGLPGAPSQVIGDLPGCHSANFDHAHRMLFVPTLKQDRICIFNLNDRGELIPAVQPDVKTAAGAGPRHMAFHPNQRYAWCINELDSSVDLWKLDEPDGQVKWLQRVDMMPPDFRGTRWAADIHITPDGRFLYSCDRTASIITLFEVSEAGDALMAAQYQPTETQPRGFNIDNSGQYLIAAGQKSDHIAVYRIDKTDGKLQLLSRYATGKGPMWVVINTLN